MRIGIGYDVHRFKKGRKLILGGVEINYPKGLLGWSDADVLVHAIIDAIIGALGLGDIGAHFPDTDSKFKDISSLKLLEYVKQLLIQNEHVVSNIDATIVAQEPKLSPHTEEMKENIAETLGINAKQVNIKSKTEEGLGFTGSKKGIKAYAVCLIHRAV